MRERSGRNSGGRRSRRRGITLLLTLIVLVLLAVVLVEFQTDATLHERTEQFRLDRLQCRYAAESGMIIGTAMIKQARQRRFERSAAPNPSAEPNAPVGSLPASEPNVGTEPAALPPEPTAPERPAFVMIQRTLEIGPATVTIEIHDENAKWPLLWLLRSPFDMGSASDGAEKSLRRWAESLGVPFEVVRETVARAQVIGRPLPLPLAPIQFTGGTDSGRLSIRGRRANYAERVAQTKKRYEIMTQFAAQWQYALTHDPKAQVLRQALAGRPGDYHEYLSPWGACQINLNTAPAELLYCAFADLGLTAGQAQAIVDYRRQTPLGTPNMLHNVQGLDVQLVNNLAGIGVVTSDTFSIHVDAAIGRIHARLTGGVYQDLDWRILAAGIFPED